MRNIHSCDIDMRKFCGDGRKLNSKANNWNKRYRGQSKMKKSKNSKQKLLVDSKNNYFLFSELN